MERDMGTRIATRADLQYLGAELRQEILMVRKDLQLLEANLKSELTLRLGSMMVVLIGLLFAALKLT
jgi:hypothetical protein